MLVSAFPAYLVAVIFVIPLLLTAAHLRTPRTVGDDQRSPCKQISCLPRILNSAVLFALAYNVVFLFQELWLVLPKAYLGMRATLFHNNHDWQINHPLQDLLQGTGALAIIILGLISVAVLARLRDSTGPFRLFAIWMVYQSLAQSLPQLADLVMNPDGDVGTALTYLGVNQNAGAVIGYLSFAAVALIGVQLSRMVLELAPSDDFVRTPKARVVFVFQIGILAGLLGFALIIPFRLPPFELEPLIGPFLLAFFPMLWILAAATRHKATQPKGNQVNKQIARTPVVTLVGLLAVCQYWLRDGLHFF